MIVCQQPAINPSHPTTATAAASPGRCNVTALMGVGSHQGAANNPRANQSAAPKEAAHEVSSSSSDDEEYASDFSLEDKTSQRCVGKEKKEELGDLSVIITDDSRSEHDFDAGITITPESQDHDPFLLDTLQKSPFSDTVSTRAYESNLTDEQLHEIIANNETSKSMSPLHRIMCTSEGRPNLKLFTSNNTALDKSQNDGIASWEDQLSEFRSFGASLMVE